MEMLAAAVGALTGSWTLPATLIGGVAMALVHAVMPSERWLLDLVVSLALGGIAYVVALLAVGLPTNERTALFAMARKVLRPSR
jgi:hypothetical protein